MPVETSIMENGLRVVTETLPHAETVAFCVGVGVGSRDEEKNQAGISHFVEHMLFRGTKKHDGSELDMLFDTMAASHNAATSKETTFYSAEVMPHNADQCFGLLADMVQHPKFSAKHFDVERAVVIEELRDLKDMPDELVAGQAHRGSFSKQAFGREIIGKQASLKKLTPDDLKGFFAKHYRPDNMVISMSGNISHEQAVEMVSKQFHTRVATKAKHAMPATGNARFQPVTIKKKKPSLAQSYCHMIYSLPNEVMKGNSTALAAYNHILSGCAISRLNRKLREKGGLLYNVDGDIERGREHCLLEISASTSPRNLNTLCGIVEQVVAELGKNGITPAELEAIKNQAGMSLIKMYRDPSEVAEMHCELTLLSGHTSSKEEDVKSIQALTIEQVNAVAKQVAAQTPTVAMLTRQGRSRDKD